MIKATIRGNLDTPEKNKKPYQILSALNLSKV
jgi:hypothetical protein